MILNVMGWIWINAMITLNTIPEEENLIWISIGMHASFNHKHSWLRSLLSSQVNFPTTDEKRNVGPFQLHYRNRPGFHPIHIQFIYEKWVSLQLNSFNKIFIWSGACCFRIFTICVHKKIRKVHAQIFVSWKI